MRDNSRTLFYVFIIAALAASVIMLLVSLGDKGSQPTSTVPTIIGIMYTPTGEATSYIIFQDNFLDDRGIWSLAGNSVIQKGELDIEPGTGASPYFDTEYSDFRLETEFRHINPAQNSELTIYLRRQVPECSVGNCSIAISISAVWKTITVRRISSAENTVILGNIPATTLDSATWNRVTIIAKGNEYSVFVNDVSVLNFIDSTYQSGKFLFWTEGEGEGRSPTAIHYVRIYTLP